MNSIVIYATRTGNTRMIAEAIAAELRTRGTTDVLAVDEAPATLPPETDLVVVGGPTEAHGMTPPLTQYFDGLAPTALQGTAAAAFDTRLDWPRWLSGSAAAGITKRLKRAGAQVAAPAESFIVTKGPELAPGEVERAAAWATRVADIVVAGTPATPLPEHA